MREITPSGQDMARELGLEAEAYARFIALLEREQGVLAELGTDTLFALATEKSAQLAELDRMARRRSSFLQAHGCSPDPAGMQAWLAGREVESNAWNRLLATARRARAVNEGNGRLIAQHLHRCQRQSAFLQNAASNQSTYDAEGYSRATAARRSLGEA